MFGFGNGPPHLLTCATKADGQRVIVQAGKDPTAIDLKFKCGELHLDRQETDPKEVQDLAFSFSETEADREQAHQDHDDDHGDSAEVIQEARHLLPRQERRQNRGISQAAMRSVWEMVVEGHSRSSDGETL